MRLVSTVHTRGAADVQASLSSGFLRSSEIFPERPALEVGGEVVSYRALRDRAAALASTVERRSPEGSTPLTAVFAHRSAVGFAGILGALFAGHGYVPLNRTFPVARTQWMLRRSGCRSLIVDQESEEQLDSLLESVPWSMLVVLPGRQDVAALAERWPRHSVVGSGGLESPGTWRPRPPSPDDVAYLLFTSGSTGDPKGVMVSHRNVAHFVDVMTARYGITAVDRFSQMFDTTFDLSVFDLFVAWQSGACVCCPSRKALLNPDKFIREGRLTVWGSVPSVGVFMKRFGVLKPHRYPSLRWSVFCGEPLPIDVATAWCQAAPHSTLENLYGPTELTVACSTYRWDSERSPGECENGVVPIGREFPGMQALVVNDELYEVPCGSVGELLMSGPQVTPGYWQNTEATRRSYVIPPGHADIFYRTGDRVRRPADGGSLTYVGRADYQVKILGYRVELAEVESRLRAEPGIDEAVALGWPLTATGAGGVVAFVTGTDIDVESVRSRMKATLQEYAVPHTIHVLPKLPQTSNGKVDRHALRKFLES